MYVWNPATGEEEFVEPETFAAVDSQTGQVVYADSQQGLSDSALGDLQTAAAQVGVAIIPPAPMPQSFGNWGSGTADFDKSGYTLPPAPGTALNAAPGRSSSPYVWYIVAAVALAAFLWWRFR